VAALVFALAAQVCTWSFVSPPTVQRTSEDVASPAPRSLGTQDEFYIVEEPVEPVGPLEQWWAERMIPEIGLWLIGLRNAAREVVMGADKVADDIEQALSGPPPAYELAGSRRALLSPREAVEDALQPMTRLYMKYRETIKPRCQLCTVFIRNGRLWRTCKIKRHKARQPGFGTNCMEAIHKYRRSHKMRNPGRQKRVPKGMFQKL